MIQLLNQLEAGTFADIVDIGLVSQTKHQNLRAVNRFSACVERQSWATHAVIRHRAVDLAGQFDEASLLVVFARLPSEIERIDRDAVTAKPRPGIERLE